IGKHAVHAQCAALGGSPANLDALPDPVVAAVRPNDTVIFLGRLPRALPRQRFGPPRLIVRMYDTPPAMAAHQKETRRQTRHLLDLRRKIEVGALAMIVDLRAPKTVGNRGQDTA